MKVVHSWLKEYVGDILPTAEKVEELLTFHAFEVDGVEEFEDEKIIDVDILPNRSSDCLSVRGVARELATIMNVSLEKDPLTSEISLPVTDKIIINVADKNACPRFTASLITGITIKDSPAWLQKRLRAMGQRPINNIVDTTNYVMYAIGQPMHAYDADTFPQTDGKWQIGVRFANQGETVSLLAEAGKDEDRVIELNGTELLITENNTNTPVGLAGIKGGRFAELNSNTKNIIIEAANFDSTVIRKTARRLGILTDASKRFENQPARELPIYAQQEIVKLITEIAGGVCEGMVDEYNLKSDIETVVVETANVNRLLGLSLSDDLVKEIIERTGAKVSVEKAGVFKVLSPWERTDLNIEEDYIEEVGRIHGLHNVVSIPPQANSVTEINLKQYYGDKIREILLSKGFSEVITSSFQKKGNIQLQNALASDKSYMRESLHKNITAVLDANFVHIDLLGLVDVRVFEIGTVFSKIENGIGEHTALTLGVRTKGNGFNPKDDVIVKEICSSLNEALEFELDWKIEKGVAECNLSVVLGKMNTPTKYEPFVKKEGIAYKATSAYPAIARDIALWVAGGVETDVVAEALVGAAGPLLVRHTLFDTFTKDGRTSFAFRLVFQATDRTLTDIEINQVMESVYETAKTAGWEVR